MFKQLSKRFFWQPDLDAFVAPLRIERPLQLRIDLFPQGIDNSHVDVALSPKFIHHTHLFVRRDLMNQIAQNHWGMSPPVPDVSDLQAMRTAYAGMMEAAIEKARDNFRLELIQLLQLGVIKFVLQVVDQEFERLRNQLQRARDANQGQSGDRSVELHERVITLAREEPALRYRIVLKLFKELQKLENTRLSKIRQSFLREAWPVSSQLLSNPMLQLPSLWADEQLMHHYTLVCTDQNDLQAFDRINRLVTGIFIDFLPDWAVCADTIPGSGQVPEEAVAPASGQITADKATLPGFSEVSALLAHTLEAKEYEQGLLSWLDTPSNMELLLNSVRPSGAQGSGPSPVKTTNPWKQEQWPAYHRRLIKRIFQGFRNNRVDQKILASYAAPAIFEEMDGRIPVRTIYRYLSGTLRRRDVQRQLSVTQLPLGPVQTMKTLDRALTGIRHMPNRHRLHLLTRFMCDFAVLRRDLKLSYRAYRAMDQIHVLTRPRDLDLSRSNGSLHEFLLREEQQPELHRIRGHVVLKADVRGSTEIISQLRDRNLNPASHFSLNFFEPINNLLAGYGAKKIFVEGDAVILSVFEYEDMPYQWLCVSQACGLARKIIQVVDDKNVKNREYGLPELELGLGIAFSDEAPTFLYDEEKEIMISPAINRADQLSSCSSILRQSDFSAGLGRGIEVVSPGRDGLLDKDSHDRMLRYNVMGIELDMQAFMKLQSEVSLKVVELEDMVYPGGSRFHVGRFPDLQGNMHWLVVREAPVRVWLGGKPGNGEQHGHRFYQVVSDRDVIDRILAKLKEHKSLHSMAQSVPDQEWNPPADPRYLH